MKDAIYSLVLVLIFIGCDSEDNPFNNDTKPKFLLLKKVTSEDENYTNIDEFIYLDNKLITRTYDFFNKSSNSHSYSKTEYEYISENEYFRYYFSDNELKSKYRYFKPNPNTISKEELDPLTGELLSYSLREIGNSCGVTKYNFYDNNNILTNRTEIDYYNSNCSFNASRYDSDGNFMGKQQSVTDNKKSPYMTLYNSNFYRINPENWHNTIEYMFRDKNNILTTTEKSTFEYNEDGYPTFRESVTQYNDGTTRVTTYYYEYY